METAIIILVVSLTVVAFWKYRPELFSLSTLAWIGLAYYLFNLTYPEGNTYLATAFGVVGMAGAIVNAVFIYLSAIKLRDERRAARPKKLTYNEKKAANKERIKNLTTLRRRSPWDY